MPNRNPIQIGERFGRLTVIAPAPPKYKTDGYAIYCVRVRCDCGKELAVYESKLRYGSTKSCGCLQIELSINNLPKATHRMTRTPTYLSWQEAHARCERPTHKSYKNYGERGIKVCESWNLFENFLRDMGIKPGGLTLERINNDGNYEPNNCR